MSEKRRGLRRRTLKGGRVMIGTTETFDCVVRDLSESGARLQFPGMVGIPEKFDLTLTSDRIRIPARRAWLRGNEAGIRFAKSPQPARKTAA